MEARHGVFALYASIILLVAWTFFSTPQESRFVRAEASLPPFRASILFGGDMLFDRTIRTRMEREGDDSIFSCIKHILESSDLVVANLEGPITSHDSVSVGTAPGMSGNYTFTFPPSTADTLARHNVRVVNIGNNHILNFGYEGLFETKEWLSSADVRFFGDPADNAALYEYVGGIPFAFVNYNEFLGASKSSLDRTITEIKGAKKRGYVVIVYTHWGEEYVPATERMKGRAHAFVEAGADLVIGSHPHVVQESEIFKGTPIYYSLGNFIFDQYWDESVRRGLLVRVSFVSTGIVSVEEIPVDSQTGRRPCAV